MAEGAKSCVREAAKAEQSGGKMGAKSYAGNRYYY